MSYLFIQTMIGSAACAGVIACAGLACLRNRRHRMREAVVELAGDLHARCMRVQASAREAMSCIHWIGGLPDVAAAAVRSELREIRNLAARANGISRAAAEVMEACEGVSPASPFHLRELHAELSAYHRRLAHIEDAMHDRHALLSHSRTLLVRHAADLSATPEAPESASFREALACNV